MLDWTTSDIIEDELPTDDLGSRIEGPGWSAEDMRDGESCFIMPGALGSSSWSRMEHASQGRIPKQRDQKLASPRTSMLKRSCRMFVSNCPPWNLQPAQQLAPSMPAIQLLLGHADLEEDSDGISPQLWTPSHRDVSTAAAKSRERGCRIGTRILCDFLYGLAREANSPNTITFREVEEIRIYLERNGTESYDPTANGYLARHRSWEEVARRMRTIESFACSVVSTPVGLSAISKDLVFLLGLGINGKEQFDDFLRRIVSNQRGLVTSVSHETTGSADFTANMMLPPALADLWLSWSGSQVGDTGIIVSQCRLLEIHDDGISSVLISSRSCVATVADTPEIRNPELTRVSLNVTLSECNIKDQSVVEGPLICYGSQSSIPLLAFVVTITPSRLYTSTDEWTRAARSINQ